MKKVTLWEAEAGKYMEVKPLMTEEFKEEIKSFRTCKNKNKALTEKEVLTAFYIPGHDAMWIAVSGRKCSDGDYEFFGYCHIFMWEWGYFRLSELETYLDNGILVQRIENCDGLIVEDLVNWNTAIEKVRERYRSLDEEE